MNEHQDSASLQDQAAEAYLRESRAKMRGSAFWASVFGCCGCVLLIPIPLAIIGALFL